MLAHLRKKTVHAVQLKKQPKMNAQEREDPVFKITFACRAEAAFFTD